MTAAVVSKVVQRRIDTAEWIDRQAEPFEIMDAQRALGFTHGLVYGVLRDMEARGLLRRYRGRPRSRPTPNGGATMYELI
ncbi:MAG TPA: hypothetical protein VIV12_11565 [Streptosporangiaceae bacterium]